MSEAARGPSLTLRRVLPAPPERVFRAWTEPEDVRRWMSPHGPSVAEAEIDLRVGGQFRIVMAGAGMTLEHTGEYHEIDPPRRLVFSWQSPYVGEGGSMVTVELEPHGAGTQLVLTHQQLPPAQVERHEGGWSQLFERLEAHLQAPG